MPIVPPPPLATPTAAQLYEYNLHRETCLALDIPQSTLQHRSLMGSISAPSATGVTTYTGPDPRTTPPVTTDTLVWATWQPQLMRTSHEPETGRQSEQRMIGQMPSIDDNGALVTVSHDDSLLDGNGQRYRILNPTIQPDLGFFSFEMIKRR